MWFLQVRKTDLFWLLKERPFTRCFLQAEIIIYSFIYLLSCLFLSLLYLCQLTMTALRTNQSEREKEMGRDKSICKKKKNKKKKKLPLLERRKWCFICVNVWFHGEDKRLGKYLFCLYTCFVCMEHRWIGIGCFYIYIYIYIYIYVYIYIYIYAS